MPKVFFDIDRARIEGAESDHEKLMAEVKSWQGQFVDDFDRWLAASILVNEGGRIVRSAANYRKTAGVADFFRAFIKKMQNAVLPLILRAFDLSGERNADYFEKIESPAKQTAIEKGVELALLRFGFNPQSGRLVDGGYFQALFGLGDLGATVGKYVNAAISAQMPLGKFRAFFRRVFTGRGGAGMLERHFITRTFDLFQTVDRGIHKALADEAGFAHWVYNGTIIATTRPFCRARVGKPFTEAEVLAWANLEWAGKMPFYDPHLDCGGYNCRHHLSAISETLYKALKK